MKKYIIPSFILIITLSSCEKKLDIDLPDSEKHIVLNGIMNTDKTIEVQLTKSQNVLDNNENIIFLENADVNLFHNDIFIESLSYLDSGFFTSTIFPEIGKEYEIKVEANGLNSAFAKSKLQQAVPIISIDTTISLNYYESDSEFDTYFDFEIHYEINFEDISTESNYYFLSINYEVPYYEFDDNSGEWIFVEDVIQQQWFDSQDLAFNDEGQDFRLDGMQGKVFSDELFNGKAYSLDISSYFAPYYEPSEPGSIKINVIFMTVNEDLYRYIKSYNLNQTSIENPFAQPVQVFSNVQNGLGLFSGYTMYTDTLNFEY